MGGVYGPQLMPRLNKLNMVYKWLMINKKPQLGLRIKNTIKNVLFFVLQKKNSPIKEMHELFLKIMLEQRVSSIFVQLTCLLAYISGPNAVILTITSQA